MPEVLVHEDTEVRAHASPSEDSLRRIAPRIATLSDDRFPEALDALKAGMGIVADIISKDWESDRYMRGVFDLESD